MSIDTEENKNEPLGFYVTEDRIKLALKQYKESHKYFNLSITFYSISLSLFLPLLTSTFNSILGFSPDAVKLLVIAGCIFFFIMAVANTIRHIANKIHSVANEEQFILALQAKKKPEKLKKISSPNFKFSYFLKLFLRISLYLLPIFLYLLVCSLAGWNNIWSKVPDSNGWQTWVVTLILSILWFAFTLVPLLMNWTEIAEAFDQIFD